MKEMLTANEKTNVNARLIPSCRIFPAVRGISFTILFGLENDVPLKVGDPAPEFELPAVAGENKITIRSRDYLGKQNLVVTFHPLDWTPT
jgi:hypothetical protein